MFAGRRKRRLDLDRRQGAARAPRDDDVNFDVVVGSPVRKFEIQVLVVVHPKHLLDDPGLEHFSVPGRTLDGFDADFAAQSVRDAIIKEIKMIGQARLAILPLRNSLH